MRASSLARSRQLAFAFALTALAPGVARARRGVSRHAEPRTQVREAAPPLEVQPMGARAAGATDAMRARMREHVAHHLRALTDGELLTSPSGYLVDGSIDTLELVERPDGLAISCSVRLILSARRSGAMLAMSTGQATLETPRRPHGPTPERLELEVLEGAVRAASDELIQHFEARRKS